MIARSASTILVSCTLLALASPPARASLFSLATSGTISSNSSGDATIPIGTPWAFELTFDTAAPDLDFELIGSPDPTFGRFKNSAVPPALISFHYQAGDYEVTLDDPADFGLFSEALITFTNVNAIDVNIHAPQLFPRLADRQVSFHADFNRFNLPPVLSSDGLPTNTDLGPASFDLSTVSLLPLGGGEVSGGGVTTLTLTAVPVPQVPGDFNLNGVLDTDDIDVLSAAIRNASTDARYDLNQDGAINAGDRGTWVADLKRTFFGDSDLNDEFNSSDFILVFEAGKYESGQAAGWASGDWNGDGVFDTADFVAAFVDGGYEQGPRPGVAAVPEPSVITLAALAIAAVACRARRRNSLRFRRSRTSGDSLRSAPTTHHESH